MLLSIPKSKPKDKTLIQDKCLGGRAQLEPWTIQPMRWGFMQERFTAQSSGPLVLVAQQPWTCWELQTQVPVRVECDRADKAPTLSRAHSRSSLNVDTPSFFLEPWKRSKELWPLGILQEFIWGNLEFGVGGGNGTQ